MSCGLITHHSLFANSEYASVISISASAFTPRAEPSRFAARKAARVAVSVARPGFVPPPRSDDLRLWTNRESHRGCELPLVGVKG